MRVERLTRPGFTLLEVLVAMAILMIIVLIVSGMFQQSRIAWENGLRKTECTTEGRAALALMADELSRAVKDGPGGVFRTPFPTWVGNGSHIEFFTLGTSSNGARSVKHIIYNQSGSELQRTCTTLNPALPYPTQAGAPQIVALAENLMPNGLTFTTPGGTYTTNLPLWVNIQLALGRNSDYSVVRVSSQGADDTDATDDIRSWESRL